MLLYAV